MPRDKNPDIHPDTDEKTYYSNDLDKDLHRIAGVVANIPDVEPPDELIESVMARVQAKRLGWWKKFWRLPQIPISTTPFKIAYVGALAMALTLTVLVFSDRTPDDGKVASFVKEANERVADVIFVLDMPGASTVQVIGSFNRWTPEGFDMKRDEERGLWVLPLRLDSGRYEYAFLVDDRIVVSDPVALVHQDDGFGNKNSILIVEGDNLHGTAI